MKKLILLMSGAFGTKICAWCGREFDDNCLIPPCSDYCSPKCESEAGG